MKIKYRFSKPYRTISKGKRSAEGKERKPPPRSMKGNVMVQGLVG